MLRALNLTGNEELRKNDLHKTYGEVAGNYLIQMKTKLYCRNFRSDHSTQLTEKFLASNQ